MKISLNWLKKYVDIKIPNDELIRLIGARLVEVEAVNDETHKYDNIYIVRVEKAEKIPDTHLALCQIDVGKSDLVQVVCGAPNVRAGMLAVWIAPGAVVPASVDEGAPFVIGKRKMLGKYESNGMLAGADELGFDDKHEKIAEIDPKMAKPGDLLADVFELNDLILDIENKSLTHRPDCFGVIGFAREIAGILGEKFDFDSSFDTMMLRTRSNLLHLESSPAHYGHTQGRSAKPVVRSGSVTDSNLEIKITDPKICPRYSALVLEKHGELKQKYLSMEQILLAKSGMRTIDPIVDATNYLMLLTGQPLHAFDYDKFVKVGQTKKPQIGVRLAKNGEKLLLLDDKEVVLNGDDIVITSGDTPVALAGAMGGKSTEIDENTHNIILEAATFSLYNLRKTQMAHGIFSEAITRFTKGQPAYQTLAVAEQCAAMLSDGFKVVSAADDYPKPLSQIVVKITTDAVNDLLGTDYSAAKITKTLENVGFVVTANAGKATMNVAVPAWRTDIHIKEDIIEEVGRLLGYDNIVPVLPLHQTAEINPMLAFKTQVRQVLRRLGGNEVLTYSFVSGQLLEKSAQDPQNSYKIVNSISPELQYIRQSIVPSLLDKARLNQKIPFDRFALFEMNKVYQKTWGLDQEKVPIEKSQLGFVMAERKNSGTAYYKAKRYAERLLAELNIAAEFWPLEERTKSKANQKSQQIDLATMQPFEPKRSAAIVTKSGDVVGVVGEFKNSVRYDFKLEPYLAGFEMNLEGLLANVNTQPEIYLGDIEKRDLTVKTNKTYAKLVDDINKILAKHQLVVEITPLGIYQPEGAKDKNISVHLEFHDKLNEKQLKKIMQEMENL